MLKKIIGILANMFLGFLTCPCLIIFITDIQGTTKGTAYTIPEVERDIYAMFGWLVLGIWLIILICAEIAILKFLFKRNLYMLCIGIFTLFLSAFIVFFLGVWN